MIEQSIATRTKRQGKTSRLAIKPIVSGIMGWVSIVAKLKTFRMSVAVYAVEGRIADFGRKALQMLSLVST